jgi:hypothetical protein
VTRGIRSAAAANTVLMATDPTTATAEWFRVGSCVPHAGRPAFGRNGAGGTGTMYPSMFIAILSRARPPNSIRPAERHDR